MLGFRGSKLCKERFLVLKIERKRNRITWNTAMNVVFWVLFCFSAEKQSTNPTFPCQTSLVDTVGFFLCSYFGDTGNHFSLQFFTNQNHQYMPTSKHISSSLTRWASCHKTREVSLFIKRYNTIQHNTTDLR